MDPNKCPHGFDCRFIMVADIAREIFRISSEYCVLCVLKTANGKETALVHNKPNPNLLNDHALQRCAREAAARLALTHACSGHRTSWQSRHDEHGLYGGAIVAGDQILSVAGFSETQNEAVALVLGVVCNCLRDPQAQVLSTYSGNRFHYIRLRDNADSELSVMV